MHAFHDHMTGEKELNVYNVGSVVSGVTTFTRLGKPLSGVPKYWLIATLARYYPPI